MRNYKVSTEQPSHEQSVQHGTGSGQHPGQHQQNETEFGAHDGGVVQGGVRWPHGGHRPWSQGERSHELQKASENISGPGSLRRGWIGLGSACSAAAWALGQRGSRGQRRTNC